MRKLASVQKITSLTPIPKADRIEVARVLGWNVVVQKGLYEVGDLVVYFEIDSILPEQPWCEFMRERKFRVKTIKLRKQISQGLCIPISETLAYQWTEYGKTISEGMDVTDILEVKKHDPEAAKEAKANSSTPRQPVPHAWMMRFGVTRKLHRLLWPRKKGSWPEWFPKTDETRVQNIFPMQVCRDRKMYWTEKLDGQSVTIFYAADQKVGLFKKGLFGVCSRNIWYKTECDNNWWNVARKYELDKFLPEYCDNTGQSLAIQGEICGPGIQGNPYKLDEKQLFVFSVYDIKAERYLDKDHKDILADALSLEVVPFVREDYIDEDSEYDFLTQAEGMSLLNPSVDREGLVFRCCWDDSISFKAISNRHLLKKER